ncbi:MAG: NAD(P)-dependent oxidoreductase [Cyanobacteria bacterium P01_H01_bin.15]
MTQRKIFITGASGCIGQYLVRHLVQNPENFLYLLVRSPEKLREDLRSHPQVKLLAADLKDVEDFADILSSVEVAVLAAAAWGGEAEAKLVNLTQNLKILNLLNSKVCQHIFYFSTASVLDRQNNLLPEARAFGTDYIATKYDCLQALDQSDWRDKITVVFPTLVFGGEPGLPYSHISAGLADTLKYMPLIRWFRTEGSFHCVHAEDIARVLGHLIQNPNDIPAHYVVLGNPPINVNRAIAEICEYLKLKIYFRVSLTRWLVNVFIKVFRIQMDDWSRFSLEYRHFTYTNPVNPRSFGLKSHCPTISELLKKSGV